MPDISQIIRVAKQAGQIIMQHYQADKIEINYKADASPVSAADLASNQFICDELIHLYPEIPIISEESDNLPLSKNIFWSIDPLDGTKSFLSRDGEFTVNIALVIDSIAILGVVYSPLSDELYYVDQQKIPYKESTKEGLQIIQARAVPNDGATVLVSAASMNKPKLEQYLQAKQVKQIIPTSSALKICLIAEGAADLYPRFGQTMEWDTAAGHAILTAAGGSITDLNGKSISYGNLAQQYYNPEFIAKGK